MPEAFPPVVELLPHRGRAVLLERVLAHDDGSTSCLVEASRAALYRDAAGRIPSCVGLEMLAQTVAAHGGLIDRRRQQAPRPGFFLGSRRLSFGCDFLPEDRPLVATVRFLRGSAKLLAFDCALGAAGDDAAQPMVSGVLSVYLLDSFEALVEDFSAEG